MKTKLEFKKYIKTLNTLNPIRQNGTISQIIGLIIESYGPAASIGDVCYIHTKDGKKHIAEVVGFREDSIILMPYDNIL